MQYMHLLITKCSTHNKSKPVACFCPVFGLSFENVTVSLPSNLAYSTDVKEFKIPHGLFRDLGADKTFTTR